MKNIIFLISFFLVFSCVDVEVETVFNKDKTGEVIVTLKVEREAIKVLKEEFQSEDQFIDSFNLEGEIRKEIENKEGVELIDIVRDATDNYYSLVCRFSFEKVEAFYRQENGVFSVFLVEDGGYFTYRSFLKDVYQNIVTRNDSVYDDIPEITFKVKSFKKIKSANFGKLDEDGMSVAYVPTQEEIEAADENTKWEVVW